MMSSSKKITTIVVVLAALVLGGWALLHNAESKTAPPNVLVIVMDTVRQDRLSLHGYSKKTSPNLVSLAGESRVYSNAHSTSSWTASAHASLFTGLYPISHQCTQEKWQLDGGLTTMAELLSAGGYQTFAIVENPVVSRKNGFAKGFDAYYEVWRSGSIRHGSATAETLAFFDDIIANRDISRPFMLFVNLIGPHSPYNSSGDFKKQFVEDSSIGLNANLWRQYYLGQKVFSSAELRHLNELYDAELRAADEAVGQMVSRLREARLLDHCLLIITSDHGENIGDHEHMDHVFSLYETTTKVPLLVRYPHLVDGGTRYDDPVQLTDVLPTVLDAADIDLQGMSVAGRSLLNKKGVPGRPVFCEYYRPVQAKRAMRKAGAKFLDEKLAAFDRRIRSITQGGIKLIWGEDGKNELYDLNVDPHELNNLLDDPQYKSARENLMELMMATISKSLKQASPQEGSLEEILDEETEAALRSLGYLD